MTFIIIELGKDISSLIWKKLDSLDRFIVLSLDRKIECKSSKLCTEIAKNGYLELLKWAREKDYSWDEQTFSDAAGEGYLEVLKWLKEEGCPWNEYVYKSAALKGHLEILKWLIEQSYPWNTDGDSCSDEEDEGRLDMEIPHLAEIWKF